MSLSLNPDDYKKIEDIKILDNYLEDSKNLLLKKLESINSELREQNIEYKKRISLLYEQKNYLMYYKLI
ncbi:hypothetical protein [Staphylococcus epidermidis]|uniref:hypothetical protein n=1 Tax=Staphylococcus epidermidis TaxID=1282 RepID=UPI00029933C1|nr:hypothetical protein [Staphylococcus epidermidis]EKS23233.1 hypothetical protein HMPREF9281_02435 [Staphylococcus epidermidis BVS058A4]